MKVESSSIDEVKYSQKKREMVLKFKNGGLYKYRNISRYMRDALVGAESVGKFFAARIRPYDELYPYERLG